MNRQMEIDHQLRRRFELISHISWLYRTGRPVKTMILNAEHEIECVEKRLEQLGYVRN